MPDCDGLHETTVEREASVELPENVLGDWVPKTPDLLPGAPGLFTLNGFHVPQGGHAILNNTFGVANLWTSVFNRSNPAAWCEKKGTHEPFIKVRGICKYNSAEALDDQDYDYFWVQAETQIGTECGKQQLGLCRILKVSKKGAANRTYIESQDGPEGPFVDHGVPQGPGGSMSEANNGSSLILRWHTCPSVMKIEQVIAVSLM
jgi:hypothetical protein